MLSKLYKGPIKTISERVGAEPYLKEFYIRSRPNRVLYQNMVRRHKRAEIASVSEKIYWFSSEDVIDIYPPTFPFENEIPSEFEKIIGTHKINRPFVAKINNGNIIKELGVSTTKDYSLIIESSISREYRIFHFLKNNRSEFFEIIRSQKLNIRGENESYDVENAVNMIRMPDYNDKSRSKNGYSHWIQSYLTQLEGVKYFEQKTGVKPNLVVESNPPNWIKQSLEFYEYYPDNIVHWEPDQDLKVKNLIVPSIRRKEQTIDYRKSDLGSLYKLPSRNACEWLRQYSQSILEEKSIDTTFSKKVLISRADVNRREIANRDELLAELSERGFEAYELSSLTFPEQVKLFSQAEQIIGVHGAGLSNIMFADNAKIVEIFGSYIKPSFYLQSLSSGNEFRGLCAKTQEPKSDDLLDVDRNVYISPKEVKYALDN